MNYYIDIRIEPDSGMHLNVLLNRMYTRFHKALYDKDTTNIGVSFPKYNIILGNVLRIHGDKVTLQNLLDLNWLDQISDHFIIGTIMPVPENTKFRTISRKQTTMSQSKLRRLIKRGSIPQNEIQQYTKKMYSKGIDNPFLELISSSNGQKYRRYIEFGELVDHPIYGKFDHFGLSKTATIPWFD